MKVNKSIVLQSRLRASKALASSLNETGVAISLLIPYECDVRHLLVV